MEISNSETRSAHEIQAFYQGMEDEIMMKFL